MGLGVFRKNLSKLFRRVVAVYRKPLTTKTMKIKLSKERAKELTEKVQVYMENEFGESIGELKAGFLIEFFTKELGEAIYNQAIHDAQSFMQDKLIDLESTLFFEAD